MHTNRIERDERGAALVLVAIMLTAMLAVAGLVLDGSFGYTNHRQMQNAADVSALAGARQLQLMRFAGDTGSILTIARNQASKNGSLLDTASFDCRVLTLAQAQLSTLPAMSTLATCNSVTTANASSYVGVVVKSGETHTTFLGGFTNQATQRTSGVAAATVQRSMGFVGPWIICGVGPDPEAPAPSGNPNANGFNLIDPSTGLLYSDEYLARRYGVALDWPNLFAPGGRGSGTTEYDTGRWGIQIHGSQVKDNDCGLKSANWKGLRDKDTPVAIGADVPPDNGNQVGHYKYEDTLARQDGCPGNAGGNTPVDTEDYNDCLVILPIFDTSRVNVGLAHIVDVAVFRVFYRRTAQPKYYAQFVCRSTCSLRGGPSTSNLGAGGIPVVKLIK